MTNVIQRIIEKARIFLKSKLSGFTLVELTVVLLIIGVLASILIPVVTNRVTDAKYTQALADIAKMETALAAYELDLQDFPPSGITNMTMFLLHSSTGSAFSAPKGWHGPYLDVKTDRIISIATTANLFGTGSTQAIVDPWGHVYSYVHWRDYQSLGTYVPGTYTGNTVTISTTGLLSQEETWFNPRGYQIYSRGKNGITYAFPWAGLESDDVNNWYGDERQNYTPFIP